MSSVPSQSAQYEMSGQSVQTLRRVAADVDLVSSEIAGSRDRIIDRGIAGSLGRRITGSWGRRIAGSWDRETLRTYRDEEGSHPWLLSEGLFGHVRHAVDVGAK